MGVFYPLDFFSYFCKGKKFRSSSDYPPNEIYDFTQSIPLNKHHITVDNSLTLLYTVYIKEAGHEDYN